MRRRKIEQMSIDVLPQRSTARIDQAHGLEMTDAAPFVGAENPKAVLRTKFGDLWVKGRSNRPSTHRLASSLNQGVEIIGYRQMQAFLARLSGEARDRRKQ